MADPKTPVLDLKTLTDVPTVTIDGTEYPLKIRALRNVLQTVELEKHRAQIAELFDLLTAGTITMEQAKELSELLNTTTRMVLDAPDEIHTKLDDDQRFDICHAFLKLQSQVLRANGAMTTQATTDPPTGSPLPPDSPASTPEAVGPGIG